MSAKFRRRQTAPEGTKKRLDTGPRKPRGRPRDGDPDVLKDNAEIFTLLLEPGSRWDRLWRSLSEATTTEHVSRAIEAAEIPDQHLLVPHAALILEVIQEPKFPKGREAQIKFLAESLAAQGAVGARRSRDIVQEERAKATGRIRRVELFIECTCGYVGPSRRWACPNCGAKIPHDWERGVFEAPPDPKDN
jgi:hypothetical protein